MWHNIWSWLCNLFTSILFQTSNECWRYIKSVLVGWSFYTSIISIDISGLFFDFFLLVYIWQIPQSFKFQMKSQETLFFHKAKYWLWVLETWSISCLQLENLCWSVVLMVTAPPCYQLDKLHCDITWPQLVMDWVKLKLAWVSEIGSLCRCHGNAGEFSLLS